MTNKRMCMKTPKEQQVENKIVRAVEVLAALTTDDFTLPRQLIRALLENEELKALQHYANHISITRLGLNDHGPVHMKKVCYNALKMLRLLHEAAECLPTAPPALLYDMCVDVCHAIYYTTERGKGKIPCPTFLCHKETAFSALPLDIYQQTPHILHFTPPNACRNRKYPYLCISVFHGIRFKVSKKVGCRDDNLFFLPHFLSPISSPKKNPPV